MKSKNLFIYPAGLVFILFFISCDSSDKTTSETGETTLEEAENAKETEIPEGDELPVHALAVMHSVESWQEWKEKFDAHKPTREELGMETLGVFVSPDDENYVTVFIRTPNHEKAREFSNSRDLKETMDKAGVLEDPTMMFIDIVKMPDREYNEKYRMMVTHKVENYEEWEKEFEKHEPQRREAGLKLIGIGRTHNYPNEVSVMFAFDNMDEARLFAESQELKDAMDEAGVIGSPTIYWYKIPDQSN